MMVMQITSGGSEKCASFDLDISTLDESMAWFVISVQFLIVYSYLFIFSEGDEVIQTRYFASCAPS